MKTPQTDDLARGNHVVPTEWAEQLERERDEARNASEAFSALAWKLEGERNEARSELSLKQQALTIAEGTLFDLRKELKEWQSLRLWGGTPEHIHQFIKGQQTRIHEAQNIEKTCEQLERERDEARELLKKALVRGDLALAETKKAKENLFWSDHQDKREIQRELAEAREQVKELREALLRVRTWGISSKNFSATDSYKMAEWIDGGCAGDLPNPDGPWIYEKMEETK